MTYLPDVNVWIALASDRHLHHRRGKHWFAAIRTDEIAFCRITEMGFLRLLTNRHVMGDDTASPKEAWQVYDALRTDRNVIFLNEISDVAPKWRAASEVPIGGPNMWTDAYLSVSQPPTRPESLRSTEVWQLRQTSKFLAID